MKKKINQALALHGSKILTRDQMKEIKGGAISSLRPCSAITCSSTRPCPSTCPTCYTATGVCGV